MRNEQPILIPIIGKESGDRWMLTGSWNGRLNLTGSWIYFFVHNGTHYRLEVPAGYDKLDGASVPRLIRPIVKMGGREMPDEAWVPHDMFYFYEGRVPNGYLKKLLSSGEWQDVDKVSRKFADQVFRDELNLRRHGLSSFKSPITYVGLRGAFWKGNW